MGFVVRIKRPLASYVIAGAISEWIDLGRQPVHVVMQRRRDVPQGVLHAQQLAVDVIGIAGPLARAD